MSEIKKYTVPVELVIDAQSPDEAMTKAVKVVHPTPGTGITEVRVRQARPWDSPPMVFEGRLIKDSLDDGGVALLTEVLPEGPRGDDEPFLTVELRSVNQNAYLTEDHTVLHPWIGKRVRVVVEDMGDQA